MSTRIPVFSFRLSAFCAGFVLLAFLPAAFAGAVKFDVPAQSASSALQAFGQQAGVEVVYPASALKKLTSTAVQGEMEPAAALMTLLSGTGYTARQISATNFAVEEVSTKPGSIEGSVREEKSGRPVAGAKVAIAGTDISVLTDRRGRFTLEGVSSGEQVLLVKAEGMQDTKVTDVTVRAGHRLSLSAIGVPVKQEGPLNLEPYTVSAKKNDGVIELDPYAIEGRKEKPFVSGNMDIPRTINDVQPYYIFDEKVIERSGAANVEDFLKQSLAMNTLVQTNGATNGITNSSLFGNTSSINLRGVGIDKTLVLVNGRRLPNVRFQNTDGQPDLNGLPLSAIERIEVLPSSASGIYGGSAIGGVVNVITKQNYVGGEIRATYENVLDGAAPRKSVSIGYGTTLGKRLSVYLSASLVDVEQILLRDRADIFRRNLDTLQVNSPTFVYSSTNPFLGTLPNITPNSATQASLVLKNGTSLNSRNTFVPANTSPTTTMADLSSGLMAGAGRWNLDLPLSTQAPSGLLRPFGTSPKTKAFQANFRFKAAAGIQLFLDGFYNDNLAKSIFNPLDISLVVPATAPTSPFTTHVRVRFPDLTAFPFETRSRNYGGTLGALIDLPAKWNAVLDYTWSENRFENLRYSTDTAKMNADLASGALNLFVDTLRYPLDVGKYIRVADYDGKNQLEAFTAKVSGSLPALSWGTPALTVGSEYRDALTPARFFEEIYPSSPLTSNRTLYFKQQATTTSGYFELTNPLVKENGRPGLASLELQLAGRIERYRVDAGTQSIQTFFNRTPPLIFYTGPTAAGQPYFAKASYSSNNFTAGLSYKPTKDLIIRFSRATAFLPPAPTQLIRDPAQSTTTTPVNDPVTGQNQVPVFTLGGGNPDLKPQNSRSTNIGIIFAPRAGILRGLRLNAEYYDIEQFDAIGSLNPQTIVNQESAFPERVIRNSNRTITQVDTSLINLYHRETAGWDFSGDYSFLTQAGRFGLNAAASVVTSLKTQSSQTLPETDAVGFPAENGVAKFKGNATLSWEHRKWAVSWTSRYFGDYKTSGAKGGPRSQTLHGGTAPGSLLYITAQGGDTIPSQLYHDVVVSYTLDNLRSKFAHALFVNGVTMQLGVRNVFNTVPPLDAFYVTNYYMSPYGDPRLRSYWLSLRLKF